MGEGGREGGVLVAEVEGVEMPKLATTAVSPISLLNHPPREREEELESNSAPRM